MVYYLILCLVGMVSFTTIIGWRRVLRWDSIAGIYLACFSLAFFFRPAFIYARKHFAQFHQLGVAPPQGWWSLEELAVKLGLAVILGLTCMALGYRQVINRGRDAARGFDEGDIQFPERLRPRLVGISLLLLLLAFYGMWHYQALPGIRDIENLEMIVLEDGSGSAYSNTTGYFALLERFTIPALVIFLLTTGNYWLTLLLVTPFALARVWTGWARQSLVHCGLSLVVAALLSPVLPRAKRRLGAVVLGLLLIFAASVFGVLGKERTAIQSYYYWGQGPVTTYAESTWQEYLAALVGFEISLHWLKYAPAVFPYEWGANYLYQFFVLPIPRVLWPDKRNIFAPTAYVRNPRYLMGCAPGCIGDAWLNGGWLGILVLFSLTGVVCGWWQRAKTWRAYPVTGLFIFAATYPLSIGLVRDGLSAIAIQLYFLGVPGILTFLVERSCKIQGNNRRPQKVQSVK
jgi:hypothetical protein